MAEPWFYHPDLSTDRLLLAGDEAHHATATRRLRPGDALWLFDGEGGLARATIVEHKARGRELQLQIVERGSQARPIPELHLACALPKGDRQAVLLDMATQLGMARFTPLECERSVVRAPAGAKARWQRICLEACKQSRRAHLPLIEDAATPRDLVRATTARGEAVFIAHPDGAPLQAAALPARCAILIGPEGGFTDAEIAAVVAHGGRQVGLGAGILRIETAAVALLALMRLSGGR